MKLKKKKKEESTWSIHDFCANTLRRSNNIQSALADISRYIASKLKVEICSIYLVDKTRENLVLEANYGLTSSDTTEKAKMKFSEGLVGLVAEKKAPIEIYDPQSHPRFKKFTFIQEEKLKTFFGFPILSQDNLVGVLVIQTIKKSKGEVIREMNIPLIAKEIGDTIGIARLTDSEIFETPVEDISSEEAHKRSYFLKGKGASVGIAIGYAHFQNTDLYKLKLSRDQFKGLDTEIVNLEKAIQQTKEELLQAEEKARKELGDEISAIFKTHLELLDEDLINEFKSMLKDGQPAGPAIEKVLEVYQQKFRESKNVYFQEREQDIIDLKNRILKALYEDVAITNSSNIKIQSIILVAEQLLPTDIIQANVNNVKGFIQTSGGITSHAAILANSISLPMVSGIQTSHEDIHEGDYLIMDAFSGLVHINPNTEILNKYNDLINKNTSEKPSSITHKEPFYTKDEKPISLMANIGLFSEAKIAKDVGADGIGLYRTEFPFLAGETIPSEEVQFDLYKKTVEIMDGLPVTIRTLDLGGDKFPKFFNFPPEKNPFLGHRSIRVSLSMIPEFKKQLKAIYRAASFGPVKLMIPMISNLEEVIKTKKLIDEVKAELTQERKKFNADVPFGIMIEVPSAALMIDTLLEHVDFASIGTNDLIQYTLAVDRNNSQVSSLFQTMNPAILKLLKLIGQAGKIHKKEISICGEMAGNQLYAPVLIGFDIKTLSMTPKSIPGIQNILGNITYSNCKKLAENSLKHPTNEDVKKYLLDEIGHMI